MADKIKHNEQREKSGNTSEVIEAVIEKCLEEGVLSELLTSRREEVRTIMRQLYDYNTILENYEHDIRQEERENSIHILVNLLQRAAQSRDMIIQAIADNYHLSEQDAAEKVAQYWTNPEP